MAGIDLGGSGQFNKGSGAKRKKRRIKIKIDMTPMVDIVMLLLIFYMVTTVFTAPQAMELNLPPDDNGDKVVGYSNLLLLRVDEHNRVSWQNWDPADRLPEMIPSKSSAEYTADTDSILSLMFNMNWSNDKMNTLVNIDPDADYSLMVDILDEIDRVERLINIQLFGEFYMHDPDLNRFSYRYAIGEWEERDGKIAEKSWENFLAEGGI